MSVRKGLIMSLAVACMGVTALAQDAGNNGGPGGDRGQAGQQGQRGQRGGRNFDPAQFQQRMMDNIKDQMKAPDDEWQVIQPKLQKVMEAQREARTGGGGMFGGRRGGQDRGNQNQNQDQSELAKASRELRDLLQQDNAAPDQINSKLAAYRAARDKAQANLKTARDSLKEVLSERQEALLVTMGILE